MLFDVEITKEDEEEADKIIAEYAKKYNGTLDSRLKKLYNVMKILSSVAGVLFVWLLLSNSKMPKNIKAVSVSLVYLSAGAVLVSGIIRLLLETKIRKQKLATSRIDRLEYTKSFIIINAFSYIISSSYLILALAITLTTKLSDNAAGALWVPFLVIVTAAIILKLYLVSALRTIRKQNMKSNTME